MKIALQGNTLLIVEADSNQFGYIKSWGKMKWDKKSQTLRGTADLELLDKLSTLVRLPPAIEERRKNLRIVQNAVDRERMNPQPTPMYAPPVKVQLYTHQIRAMNMCLLTFGWIQPERKDP